MIADQGACQRAHHTQLDCLVRQPRDAFKISESRTAAASGLGQGFKPSLEDRKSR